MIFNQARQEQMLLPAFFTYRKLRKTDLAVLPRPVARKAKIGEHMEAGTARYRKEEALPHENSPIAAER